MQKKLITILVFALVTIVGCTTLKRSSPPATKSTSSNLLLSNDVVPLRYHLNLKASPKDDYFTGQVNIKIRLNSDSDHFLLHAQDLTVSSVTIKNDSSQKNGRFSPLDNGMARIDFDERLLKGEYDLAISYKGKYQSDLSGLYKVKDGEEFYLYTQFEPLSARKMLPCFDEPRFKTPFLVKVISDKGNVVIANAGQESVSLEGSDEVHNFFATKPIPTYLLALAIGPFDVVLGPDLAKNSYRTEDIKLRGIATQGNGEKMTLALKETPLILEKLERYFGIAYPYDKLDILAVPDFAAGAMENVGAITFRDWYLLLDENASVDQRSGFYLTMAHELSHQWFGNLVTMPWWDDLWLNEAFATWLSYKIVDQIKPEFKLNERLLKKSFTAMSQDSLMAARKIREPINTVHDIHNAFDSITYSKGGAVLSMLENYLGPDKFQTAVTHYLKQFAFSVASYRDFLAALAQFSDDSLKKSAESFLNQTGVPLVKLSYRCHKGGFTIDLAQSRYAPLGSKVSKDRLWQIPVCVSYESHGDLKKHCLTLDKKSQSVDISHDSCPSIVMPNHLGQGYYRFSVDESHWEKLFKHAQILNETEKIALADSLLADLYAGNVAFSFVANNFHHLIDGSSSMLSAYFMELMEEANNYWIDQENRPSLLGYGKSGIDDIYRITMSQAVLSEDQKLLRSKVASFLANTINDQETRSLLSSLGNTFLENKPEALTSPATPIDRDLLAQALAVALQSSKDDELNQVIEHLRGLTDVVKRNYLIMGLAQSRQGDQAHHIRSLVFDKNLRKNEQLGLFWHHLKDPHNQPATWNFLKDNWAALKSTLSKSQMADLPYLAEGLCSKESAQELQQFFSPTIANYEGGPRNLSEMVERIEICAAIKGHAAHLANQFFHELSKKEATTKK